MSCTLNAGRLTPCKDSLGGIKNLYLVDFGDPTFAINENGSDEITDITGSFQYAKYEVKGDASMETTLTSSRENGTTFFEQNITANLRKLTKEDNKELKLMAYGRPHVLIQTRDDKFFWVGVENGCEVTGGTAVTGTALGDLQGYTLTLQAMERFYPNEFVTTTPPTDADPFVGIGGTATSVSTNNMPT
jgi:hypothetical protein